MIQQGSEHAVRDMADAAQQVAAEAKDLTSFRYANTVEHVLRVLVGDTEPEPMLQTILDRYSDNIG